MKKYLFILLAAFFSINNSHASEDFLRLPKIDRKPAPMKWSREKIKNIPKFDPNSNNPFQVDLRGYDLSQIDLRDSKEDLMHADFDDKTIWPAAEKMPADFDWKKIMELGKNPGLGLREVHKEGITGTTVGIALIDNPLLVNHQEYADRIRLYEEINVLEMKKAEGGQGDKAHMHGAAVVSIAAGKTLGAAPGADIYYIGTWPFVFRGGEDVMSFKNRAKAFDRILEINKQLPEDRKIRVISMSIGWNSSIDGYKEVSEAAEKAKQAGMLVICSSTESVHGFRFQGLGRPEMANPDDFNSYEPGAWWAKEFYNLYNEQQGPYNSSLLVPMDSRTTASPTGVSDYVFYSQGGWSWSIPYIAGVYALCCQVDPNITPERFWALSMRTGRNIELQHNGKKIPFGPILNPVSLIAAVKAKEPINELAAKAKIEKRRHKDTISDPNFLKDFNTKMAKLDVNEGTAEDVIRIFGKPLYYSDDKGNKVDGNSLPLTYGMFYPEGFSILISENRIAVVHIRRAGYLFEGEIGVGTSFDNVLKFFGPPDETIESTIRPKKVEAGVLYKDINGMRGKCFYKSKKYRAAVWIWDDKVFELTIVGHMPAKSEKITDADGKKRD
jgi:hypothetical protein